MRQLVILALVVLMGAGLWWWQSGGEKALPSFDTSLLNEVSQTILEGRVFTPPPLRVEIRDRSVPLASDGVFAYTNLQRIENGLTPLLFSDELALAAGAKAQDMLSRQYFAHVSPQGLSASDFVGEAGYEYLAVGENLALGNFEGDQDLVQAWMDSPGHRANILNTAWQEVGVAVAEGVFEGTRVWVGVQMFGLPASSCPRPDASLAEDISSMREEVVSLQAQLEALLPVLEEAKKSRSPQYSQLVSQYNDAVELYNHGVDALKSAISSYNLQVEAFNTCLGG